MIKYIHKDINNNEIEFQFFPAIELPKNIPISTPLSFSFIGRNLVVVKKDNGWWDVVGGKIKQGETWEEAIIREAKEEAGINIDHIRIIGYVLANNKYNVPGSKFPKTNVLPVTISFVKTVDKPWKKMETLERNALEISEAKKLLLQRNDSGQLAEILDYVVQDYDNSGYQYSFEYIKARKLEVNSLPNTQSVVFVRNEEGKFTVVKEPGQVGFSLPGGGCNMDEDGIACAIREVKEEAQIDIKNIKLLGTVIVKVISGGVVMSESTQTRYLANIGNIGEFIPEKDGFETVDRRFVNLEELREVKLLMNKTGEEILSDLMTLNI